MTTDEARNLIHLIRGTWPRGWDDRQLDAWIDALRALHPDDAHRAFTHLRNTTDTRPTIAEYHRAAGQDPGLDTPGHHGPGPDAKPYSWFRHQLEQQAAAGDPDAHRTLAIIDRGIIRKAHAA